MVEVSKLLGKSIQNARRAAGLTQQELCQKAGLSYSTLAKIERGAIKTPSVFTVKQITQVLGVTMDELLGAVVDDKPIEVKKKTSKSGISFLYLDINGCLVRFYHAAFTKMAQDTGVSSDVIESAFWHYNDNVCRGEMTMDEFNYAFAKSLDVKMVDWAAYYLEAVEPIDEMRELLEWASKHYKVGLLSNIMPGQIQMMIDDGKLPDIKYDAIIDSSEVGSIKPEQQIYDEAQKAASVNPNEVLFVDDSRTNLISAERQGWRVMWFNDYTPSESVEKIRKYLEF